MRLADLEGYDIRLIGPKQEGRLIGYPGKTTEYTGRVTNGAIVVAAPDGLYDVAYRKSAKAGWQSHPDLREHRCL